MLLFRFPFSLTTFLFSVQKKQCISFKFLYYSCSSLIMHLYPSQKGTDLMFSFWLGGVFKFWITGPHHTNSMFSMNMQKLLNLPTTPLDNGRVICSSVLVQCNDFLKSYITNKSLFCLRFYTNDFPPISYICRLKFTYLKKPKCGLALIIEKVPLIWF